MGHGRGGKSMQKNAATRLAFRATPRSRSSFRRRSTLPPPHSASKLTITKTSRIMSDTRRPPSPFAQILPSVQPEQEKEDVLRAMLFVAEDEIRAKEVQVELMQQMLVATEQVRSNMQGFRIVRDSALIPRAGDRPQRRAHRRLDRGAAAPLRTLCIVPLPCDRSVPHCRRTADCERSWRSLRSCLIAISPSVSLPAALARGHRPYARSSLQG